MVEVTDGYRCEVTFVWKAVLDGVEEEHVVVVGCGSLHLFATNGESRGECGSQ